MRVADIPWDAHDEALVYDKHNEGFIVRKYSNNTYDVFVDNSEEDVRDLWGIDIFELACLLIDFNPAYTVSFEYPT